MNQAEREGLQRQLVSAKENLQIIQEHNSKFISETDIPLENLKNERRLEREIKALKERLATTQVGVMTHGSTSEAANAEYACDFTTYFAEGALPDEGFWNETVLPRFKRLRAELLRNGISQIELYGKMHTAAALAFGYEFRRPMGLQLRVDHYGELWHTDAEPARLHDIIATDVPIDTAASPEGAVLVELSITQPVAPGVDNWLAQANLAVARRVRIAPAQGPSQRSVRDNAHAVAIAQEVRTHLDALRRAYPGQPLHLFDAQPISLAVCIGRELGTAVPVQCYVHIKGANSYQPAILLQP
jgi:hypothetical protein